MHQRGHWYAALVDRLGSRAWAWVVSAVGGLLAVATVSEWVLSYAFGPGVPTGFVLVALATNVVPGLGIAYAGRWIRRSDVDPDRYVRIAGWCLSGGAVSLAANLAIMAAMRPAELTVVVGWTRTAIVFGAVGGVTVGIVEARAIERSLAAQRARLRAAEAEEQREHLSYLNGLLRHEILNAVNVIDGFSSYVIDTEDIDPAARDRLERVRDQAERMSDLISDVRLLIDVTLEAVDHRPIDLTELLYRELDALEERHDAVAIATDVPPEATVIADEFVAHVFRNLLENAVEHNDADVPQVTVTVERTDDSVVVAVSDDGPGVPAAEQAAMFERDAAQNHGLGLFLVGQLVEQYDGSVELTETGPEGTTFTVELPRPRADDDGDGGVDEARANAPAQSSGGAAPAEGRP